MHLVINSVCILYRKVQRKGIMKRNKQAFIYRSEVKNMLKRSQITVHTTVRFIAVLKRKPATNLQKEKLLMKYLCSSSSLAPRGNMHHLCSPETQLLSCQMLQFPATVPRGLSCTNFWSHNINLRSSLIHKSVIQSILKYLFFLIIMTQITINSATEYAFNKNEKETSVTNSF